MQFSEIIALSSREKQSNWLHSVPAKFADRRIARIFSAFNFSGSWHKWLHYEGKICYTRKFCCATTTQYVKFLENALPQRIKNCTCSCCLIEDNDLIYSIRIYSTYTERRSASGNCIIDNTHCIVFSFRRNMMKMLL